MKDESDPRAEMALKRAETDRPMVPAIWWYEARNILLVNERRGRITRHEAEAFLGFFEQFNAISFAIPDNGAVMDLARKHRLTVYRGCRWPRWIGRWRQLPALKASCWLLKTQAVAQGLAAGLGASVLGGSIT